VHWQRIHLNHWLLIILIRSLVIRQIRKRKRNLLKEGVQRAEVEGMVFMWEPQQRNLL
jgi:hypothetical protein